MEHLHSSLPSDPSIDDDGQRQNIHNPQLSINRQIVPISNIHISSSQRILNLLGTGLPVETEPFSRNVQSTPQGAFFNSSPGAPLNNTSEAFYDGPAGFSGNSPQGISGNIQPGNFYGNPPGTYNSPPGTYYGNQPGICCSSPEPYNSLQGTYNSPPGTCYGNLPGICNSSLEIYSSNALGIYGNQPGTYDSPPGTYGSLPGVYYGNQSGIYDSPAENYDSPPGTSHSSSSSSNSFFHTPPGSTNPSQMIDTNTIVYPESSLSYQFRYEDSEPLPGHAPQPQVGQAYH